MSTPQGHSLSNATRYTNGTLTIFAANCECGKKFRELRRPIMWQKHDAHLTEVKSKLLRES